MRAAVALTATPTTEKQRNPLEAATPEQLAELDQAHTMSRDELLLDWLQRLASNLGRLRRYIDPESSGAWIHQEACHHLETMIAMLEPTAAELANWYAPGQDEAVDEAIRIVDARYRSLRHRFGWSA